MGVLMSKSDALRVAAAIRRIEVEGQAMVRIGIEPGEGLTVDLIRPPFGAAAAGRVERILAIKPPRPV